MSFISILLISKPGVGEIIVNCGLVAKTVLGILVFLSVVSWGITIERIRQYRLRSAATRRFLMLIRSSSSIFDLKRQAIVNRASPLARVALAGIQSLEDQTARIKNVDSVSVDRLTSTMSKSMEKEAGRVIEEMQEKLPFLATTASVAPFLGLFGTVWGVMNSFLSMGAMGSASLTVVGPGIAEALITTVFGLGVAIPALVAYNYLVGKVRKQVSQIEEFVIDVIREAEKEIRNEIESTKVSF